MAFATSDSGKNTLWQKKPKDCLSPPGAGQRRWSLIERKTFLKQCLTEKQNGYLKSGHLQEEAFKRKWLIRERELTTGMSV